MIKDAVPRMERLLWTRALILAVLTGASLGYAQTPPGGHQEHHPDQAEAGNAEPTDSTDGASGGMMDDMDAMMEKMGAPKPKEMYPKLMDFPNLPEQERARIEQEARQRVVDGTALLSEGLSELTNASARDDYSTMQAATAKMREGLAQFESGLAAHRAIAEGEAPRSVALQWFKSEMNLLPPAGVDPGFSLFGMTALHSSVMAVLIAFGAAMIWMYFLKMRRANALLETLAAAGPAAVATVAAPPSAASPDSARQPASTSAGAAAGESSAAEGATNRADISPGILHVARRKLCRLRVARIYQETTDVKTFRLIDCQGGPLPFSYLPGQFLTLTLPSGDKPIRRSYTISSSPTQGYFCEITVKREDKGAGSRYLHDTVEEGDELELQAPSGKFVFTETEADSIVLIAGGVGTTPMMSITRALTDMGWQGDIYFIVACRDPEHFIFESELNALKRRHPNLHLHVAMSRIDKDVDGYHAGRISKDSLAQWVPDIASKWIHLCGAPPMMDATKEILAQLGVPADKVHLENFGSQQKPRAKSAEREKAGSVATTETAATVSFSASDKSTRFLPDETVLEASERVDVNIDNSCRVGMCGVCTVKLSAGRVTMEVEDGLEPDDEAADMILACQAKSKGDVTVVA